MEKELKPLNPLKILLIILSIIIIIIVVILLIQRPKEKDVLNTQKLIHLKFDDTIENNILFSDIKIYKQDDYFYMTSKATNMTSNNLKISPIEITLEDDKSNKTVLTSYIGNVLNGEDSKNIIIKTNKNLKNIKNIDINVDAQV